MSRGGAEPWDVADAFVAALVAGDEGAASAVCDPDAWLAAGDSPARLYRDVVSRGLAVEAGDVERSEGRATAEVLVRHPARPDQPRTVTLLLADEGEGFLVQGLSLGALHPGAFLGGHLDARPRPEPADPAALFAQVVPEGRVGRRFRLRLDKVVEEGGTWRVAEATQLAGVGRAELHVVTQPVSGEPGEAWVYLDLDAHRIYADDSFRSWSSYLAPPAEPEPEEEEVPLAPDEDLPTL